MEGGALAYATAIVEGTLTDTEGRPSTPPVYVVKQCQEFLDIAQGRSDSWIVDESMLHKICNVLKLLIMPKGLKAGQSIHECTVGYQWLFYTAVLCVVSRDDPRRRRYETAVLEICRKNFKTYTIAVLFILLMLFEPPFSKLYSVAPDGDLSREVRDAISDTLKASPKVYRYKGKERWKNLRDYISFKPASTKYKPLNYAANRFDGRLPNAFLADEVGALPNNSAIEGMRSGQLDILNKLGCIVSTKYPTIDNPFEDEVYYAKKVLDGIVQDETVFGLLYEPDDPKPWMTDDLVLQQGNPVALEMPELWADLLKKRAQAIETERKRENFLCKHCNVIYQGTGTETYVAIDAVQAGSRKDLGFEGRLLYVGVDLAMTNDNCAVAIVFEEDDMICADVKAFIPEGRLVEKTKAERFDYQGAINAGNCIACGDMVVDYGDIEEFVERIEKDYGGEVVAVGYDRYNAMSSVQKWKASGLTTVEIEQHSRTLHPPTKLLAEKIENGEFRFRENKMLEVNFQNARCTFDTNLNRYVNKKRSNGKVDMVVALINAVYLLQQDVVFGDDFIAYY